MEIRSKDPKDTTKSEFYAAADSLNGDDASGVKSRFCLETLESRILLSADPVLGELARMAAEADAQQVDEPAAIVLELDVIAEQQNLGGDTPNNSSADAGVVDWPAEWEGSASDDSDQGDAALQSLLPAVRPGLDRLPQPVRDGAREVVGDAEHADPRRAVPAARRALIPG